VNHCRVLIRTLTVVVLTTVAVSLTTPSAASQHPAPELNADPQYCLWDMCASEDQVMIGGLVAGGAAAGTAATAYVVGPQAALAAAGGFLLFGHLLFDVVPLAVVGTAAWFYGPEVWEWAGFENQQTGQTPTI